MVLMNNDSVVIKLRLPDKKQHLSKADGYRLVEEFYSELDASKLIAHDINDHLKEIVKEGTEEQGSEE